MVYLLIDLYFFKLRWTYVAILLALMWCLCGV